MFYRFNSKIDIKFRPIKVARAWFFHIYYFAYGSILKPWERIKWDKKLPVFS